MQNAKSLRKSADWCDKQQKTFAELATFAEITYRPLARVLVFRLSLGITGSKTTNKVLSGLRN
eukprot:11535508-Prorocentrum_lima.AAC.1